MDEGWKEEEKKLVWRWTAAMPQLRHVFMMYGYANVEGIFISTFGLNLAELQGRRVLLERNSKWNWRTNSYDDSKVVLHTYPSGPQSDMDSWQT
jgi:hypothetical protein